MPPTNKEDLQKIDAALDTLLLALPELPYILTVPTGDLPHDRDGQQVEQVHWCSQSLFRPDESHLQYTSFLYRESSDGVFVVRTEVDDERDRKDRERKRLGMASAPGTPVVRTGGPKKKISLSAYKNKIASRGQSRSNSPPPHLESSKPKPPPMNGIQRSSKEGKTEILSKTPASSSDENRERTKPPESRRAKSPNPQKEARTPPPLHDSNSNDSTPHGLPPLLSPNINSNPYELPPLLSPTLPASIEAALERYHKQRKYPESTTTTSSEKTTPSKSLHKTADAETKSEQKSLIIKLKYGKRRRKDVERILRLKQRRLAPPISFSSAPKDKPRTQDRPEREHDRDSNLPPAKVSRQHEDPLLGSKPSPTSKSTMETSKETSKRPRPSENGSKPLHAAVHTPEMKASPGSDGPNKRPRLSSLGAEIRPASEPVTPQSNTSVGEFRKSQALITPKKLPKVAMARSNSMDSTLSTPKHLTPLPPPRTGESSKAPRSTPQTGRASEIGELSELSKRWNGFGRSLKHASQAINTKPATNGETDTPVVDAKAAKKRKAILSLECIMAYMIAYGFNDARSRLMGRPIEFTQSWTTLLPLVRHNAIALKDFSELDGLRAYLDWVVHNRILTAMSDKIKRSAADESADAETTRTNAKTMADVYSASLACAADAAQKLSLDTIMTDFPATFSCRTRGPPEGASGGPPRENLVKSRGLDGRFWLPVSVDTTPAQAVRFAIALLTEWVDQDDGGEPLEVLISAGPPSSPA
jgi:hypothetical protein